MSEGKQTETAQSELVASENERQKEKPASQTADQAFDEETRYAPMLRVKDSILAALFTVWLAGILLLSGVNLLRYVRIKGKVASSMRLRANIYLTDEIAMPFCLGLIRPRIYLPSSLDERERQYIILHEQHHIRRLDHVTRLLAFAALCIHWFNPFVWIAFLLAGDDMEMSCDEAVMGSLGEDIRAEYSASLLQLATGRRISLSLPAFGKGNPKRRIANIMNYKRPGKRVLAAAVLFCALAGISLLANPRTGTQSEEANPKGLLSEDQAGKGEQDGQEQGRQEVAADFAQAKADEKNDSAKEPVQGSQKEISIDLSEHYITNTGNPSNLYNIDEQNILWGCGRNEYGQLGQGTQDFDFHEKMVKIAENVIHVDYSQTGFVIYLTGDQKLYGFGNAGCGALGQYDDFDWDKYTNASRWTVNEPVLLMENIAYARCGRDDIACLTLDGKVYSMGTVSIEGGYGSQKVYYQKEPKELLENAVLVTGGWFNHAALLKDGTVWTWGYNSAGGCGVESPAVIGEPVMAAQDVTMVWTGSLHYNENCASIRDFEDVYPTYMNNTIIQVSDGSYRICGENVGTEKKLVQGALGDYTTVCSYRFYPLKSIQIKESDFIGIQQQIEAFAACWEDISEEEDLQGEPTWFALTDLDSDDVLELLITTVRGTGSYSYTRVYQTDYHGSVYSLETELDSGMGDPSEYDILQQHLTRYLDPETGAAYYLVHDSCKRTARERYDADGVMYMTGDRKRKLSSILLSQHFTSYQPEQHRYQNADKEEITKEQYETCATDYFEVNGYARASVNIGWRDRKEAEGIGAEELKNLLWESYNRFYAEIE